ncbi:MAG: hypothetical protein ACQEW7_10870 [Pseudomonadota bacterium]
MEDWQRCLAPECQAALLLARDNVSRRGGYVITVEDFLLALLDANPVISPFLMRQGVDLDELVRTIQGEQPIVTEVQSDGPLSSQLIYWLSRAREITDATWLEWWQLLKILACDCERLQDRAYVAVLELVQHWPHEPIFTTRQQPEITLVAITDKAWLAMAEDVAVVLAGDPTALIWMHGRKGIGKTVWVQNLMTMEGFEWVPLNPRRQSDVQACRAGYDVIAAGRRPVLVLDNTSPADLLALMAQPESRLSDLLAEWPGPVLLLACEQGADYRALRRLERLSGRLAERFSVPEVSCTQRRAILAAHQPAIEKRWQIQISDAALDYAAAHADTNLATPGELLQWLERASARLDFVARRGSVSAMALEAEHDALRRQSLVTMARGGSWQLLEQGMAQLKAGRADADRCWHERKQAGTLRCLQVEDLQAEPEPWLAGVSRAVHYMGQSEQKQGDTSGAGSGNLYS